MAPAKSNSGENSTVLPKDPSQSSGTKSRSERAELIFPVGRIHRLLRNGRYADRVGSSASVYMAATLEYLTAEILELAGNAARDNQRCRLLPRHVQLAVQNDEELAKLFAHVIIAEGGVLPNIPIALLPVLTRTKRPKKKSIAVPKKEATAISKKIAVAVAVAEKAIPESNDGD